MNPLLLVQDGREAAFEEATKDVFSDTPETDAALVDHMPKDATEWSEHYLALSIHARKLERERDELCQALLGRTVSCEQCNEAARKIEEMREAIKVAWIEIQYAESSFAGLALRVCPNDSAVDSVLNRMTRAIAKLQPFLK